MTAGAGLWRVLLLSSAEWSALQVVYSQVSVLL